MVTDCDFAYDAECGTCRRCGFRLCGAKPPIRRLCSVQPAPGLGDLAAAGLSAVGITKDRVEAIVGGPCGCDERQAWMNAAGEKWLGLPPGSTASEPTETTQNQ